MSQSSKEAAKEINETMKKFHKVSEELHEKSKQVGDKDLSHKLYTVRKSSQEVVEHLKKRLDPST